MPSLFTKIINGEIPSYKIAENEYAFAFLDIYPLVKGHALVIPRKEVDHLFDLDEKTYNQLWLFARTVAGAIKAAVPCERVGVVVAGFEVPHAHIHLIPVDSMSQMHFTNPKLKLSESEFKSIADRISEKL